MIGPASLNVQIPSKTEVGTVDLGTIGSPFFLLNKRADSTNIDRPYNHFGSAPTSTVPPVSAYDANVLVIPNPSRRPYLDLYVHAPSTSAPTTACVVKVYGLTCGTGLAGVELPSTNRPQLPGFAETTKASFHPAADFVYNLEDPTSGEYSLTFEVSAPVSQPETGASLPSNVANIGGWIDAATSNLKAFSTSKRRSVYCAGADFLIALITTADSRANSCLVGRLVG